MFLIRDVVSARTWLALIHTVVGLVVGLAVFVLMAGLLSVGVATLPLAFAGAPILGLALRTAGWYAAFERARCSFFLGARIPAWEPGDRAGFRWLVVPRWRAFREAATWREVGYAVFHPALALLWFLLSYGLWPFAVVLIALPAYGGRLPGGGAHIGTILIHGPGVAIAAFLGALCLLAAPQVTRGATRADSAIAQALLGKPRNLAARVAQLEETRDRVVDAAEAERTRIERDLHDGAQQRLVALAMELGRAKAKFSDDVEAAAELVDRAHVEAKAALTELRDLVRGVHPPVLTDRGLDAALSGLAARCPVPVDVRVEVPVRPRPAVEAVAYFLISEALTNIAKHSRATSARVVVEGYGFPGTLNVMVSDDGVGGANADGAGLRGLADRVAGVDGRFTVESPPGGPTIIAAVLPCGN
ncbi:MAG TPA: sensor domain-containing protein [Trebonia sp.]|jgi:signal transduction histidine kinase|nr:sensor domain-containing protein [Trebonia sp.]